MTLLQSNDSSPHRLYKITLLGDLRIELGNRVVRHFQTQKIGSLFAYLAFFIDLLHPREELVELLWSDDPPDAARNSLRVALHSLRRTLEPPGMEAGSILISDRASVRLTTETCVTDVIQFRDALRTANRAGDQETALAALISAIDLYGGDLLPGCYDEWVTAQRAALMESYLGALRKAVRLLVARGKYEMAVSFARRAALVDPLREEAHHDLIQLYIRTGQPTAALNQYAELEAILQREFGVRPSPATTDLVARLGAQLGHGMRGAGAGLEPSIQPDRAQVTERKPAEPPTGSLPVALTRFFGRSLEMERLTALLDPEAFDPTVTRPRLFTLTGSGGTGKTRLAVEVARRLSERFAGRVWFVSLADVAVPAEIPGSIRAALQLPAVANDDPLLRVAEAMRGSPALLVLDNFEHLVAGGSPTILRLLTQAPELVCLVTSRRPLSLPGEREIPVGPLEIPGEGDNLDELARCTSVQLFADRAQAVRPEFALTESNAADVARLCIRLEGIPLSIELAAARTRMLTPAEMLTRLSERFHLLSTRRADKDARHRSLWAAIEWSYRLLSPTQRRMFRDLSVFRGGWTLEAAAVVCRSGEPTRSPAGMCSGLLEALTQLQVHALIQLDVRRSETRYFLLESLREFGLAQMTPSELDAASRRHADYYLRQAEIAETRLLGAEQNTALSWFDAEHDNILAALDWAAAAGAHEVELSLAARTHRYWGMRGYYMEGHEILEGALRRASADEPSEARMLALLAAGSLSLQYPAAQARYEECLEIARMRENLGVTAAALNNLGVIAFSTGEYKTAGRRYEESLSIRREMGDRWGVAVVLLNVGNIAICLGDLERAQSLLIESRDSFRALGNEIAAATAGNNLGVVARLAGDLRAAQLHLNESLNIFQQAGFLSGIAEASANLGGVLLCEGDVESAIPCLRQALTVGVSSGDVWALIIALEECAVISSKRGDLSRATTLRAASENICAATQIHLLPPSKAAYDRLFLDAGGDPVELRAACEQGRSLTMKEAANFALNYLMDF